LRGKKSFPGEKNVWRMGRDLYKKKRTEKPVPTKKRHSFHMRGGRRTGRPTKKIKKTGTSQRALLLRLPERGKLRERETGEGDKEALPRSRGLRHALKGGGDC